MDRFWKYFCGLLCFLVLCCFVGCRRGSFL